MQPQKNELTVILNLYQPMPLSFKPLGFTYLLAKWFQACEI